MLREGQGREEQGTVFSCFLRYSQKHAAGGVFVDVDCGGGTHSEHQEEKILMFRSLQRFQISLTGYEKRAASWETALFRQREMPLFGFKKGLIGQFA
ncbi:hypothetical protein [uncultured Mailhella sp.]|uniref:hypothetical protein n=1 Tax=uncultured Mailhella sp. TaxID=1981031 RepID=UPI0025D7C21E|nr:hypothetical protein [uncultured Mailhella sp.]